MVTVLTAQGMTVTHFFVEVLVGLTHEVTHYSVNKQANNIFNLTPSGDRNYQLLLEAHRRCFLEENKFSISFCFLITIVSAEQFIMPPEGLPNQGSLKISFLQKKYFLCIYIYIFIPATVHNQSVLLPLPDAAAAGN